MVRLSYEPVSGQRKKPRPRTRKFPARCLRSTQRFSQGTQYVFCETFEAAELALTRRALLLLDSSQGERVTVGLAGVPGSGKSSLSTAVAARLNAAAGKDVAVVAPMDGFHYYKADLDRFEDPQYAHARRGAAFTFNAQAFVDSVRAIRDARRSMQDGPILMPSFDHEDGDPVQASIHVQPWHTFVLFEGLYLTRELEPWSELSGLFTEIWLLRVDLELAMRRITDRRVAMGFSPEDAQTRTETSDRVNAEEIIASRVRGTLVVDTSRAHAQTLL